MPTATCTTTTASCPRGWTFKTKCCSSCTQCGRVTLSDSSLQCMDAYNCGCSCGRCQSLATLAPCPPCAVGTVPNNNGNCRDCSCVISSIADGTTVNFAVLAQGTGKIAVTFLCSGLPTTNYIEFLDATTPTWLSSSNFIVAYPEGCGGAGITTTTDALILRIFGNINMKLYSIRTYLDGIFFLEPTLDELQAAWTGSVKVGKDEDDKKKNHFPIWEYYGRHQTFGSLPAVTSLAASEYRKCNYNLDFQGKAIQLIVDDSAATSSSSSSFSSFFSSSSFSPLATIDCGLEDVRVKAWSHRMGWLDFPRRGILMVSGEGSGTLIGPGVVVQHCAANRHMNGFIRSYPNLFRIDWDAGVSRLTKHSFCGLICGKIAVVC